MKKSDKKNIYSIVILIACIIITLIFGKTNILDNNVTDNTPANDIEIQRK